MLISVDRQYGEVSLYLMELYRWATDRGCFTVSLEVVWAGHRYRDVSLHLMSCIGRP